MKMRTISSVRRLFSRMFFRSIDEQPSLPSYLFGITTLNTLSLLCLCLSYNFSHFHLLFQFLFHHFLTYFTLYFIFHYNFLYYFISLIYTTSLSLSLCYNISRAPYFTLHHNPTIHNTPYNSSTFSTSLRNKDHH